MPHNKRSRKISSVLIQFGKNFHSQSNYRRIFKIWVLPPPFQFQLSFAAHVKIISQSRVSLGQFYFLHIQDPSKVFWLTYPFFNANLLFPGHCLPDSSLMLLLGQINHQENLCLSLLCVYFSISWPNIKGISAFPRFCDLHVLFCVANSIQHKVTCSFAGSPRSTW